MTDKILRQTLARVLAEIDRLDPANLIAARAHGVLDAVGAAPAQPTPATGRKSGWRKQPDDRDREIAAAYAGGLSFAETATKFGCAFQTVRSACERTGTPVRPRGRGASPAKRLRQHDDRMADIIARRERGETAVAIGSVYHITRERVRQLLIAAGRGDLCGATPLSPEELAAADRYVAGDGLTLAAESIGVSTFKMRKIIARAGHKVRKSPRKGRSPEQIALTERVAQLYHSGLKAREIADAVGIGRPAMIYRHLGLAGIRPKRQCKPNGVAA